MSKLSNEESQTVPEAKKWLTLLRHEDNTIKRPHEVKDELRRPPPGSFSQEDLDRVQGSMIGMALGDAVGAHVEFRPREYMKKNPVTDLRGGGTWGLERGQFTDDTSMALCLANSLVFHQDFVPYDQLVRYKWWYRDGYMSSTGKCFDIGAATQQSLNVFIDRQKTFAKQFHISYSKMDYLEDRELLKQFNVACSDIGVAGNGALMRLAPVPLFFYNYPEYAVQFSGISGLITHGDDRARDACRYYGALIVAALQNEHKDKLLSVSFYEDHLSWFGSIPLHQDVVHIANGSYKKQKGYSEGIRGKGYIVNALEAALWAFCYDDNSFEKGVLAAVNLGDDTDTTAAIYGQLAGAYYGYHKLPKKWKDLVYASEFINCLSEWIVYEGKRWQPSKSTALALSPDTEEQDNDVDVGSASNTNSDSTAHKETAPSISSPVSEASPENQAQSKSESKGTNQKEHKVGKDRNAKLLTAPKNTATATATNKGKPYSSKKQESGAVSKNNPQKNTGGERNAGIIANPTSKQSKSATTTDKRKSDSVRNKEPEAVSQGTQQDEVETKSDPDPKMKSTLKQSSDTTVTTDTEKPNSGEKQESGGVSQQNRQDMASPALNENSKVGPPSKQPRNDGRNAKGESDSGKKQGSKAVSQGTQQNKAPIVLNKASQMEPVPKQPKSSGRTDKGIYDSPKRQESGAASQGTH